MALIIVLLTLLLLPFSALAQTACPPFNNKASIKVELSVEKTLEPKMVSAASMKDKYNSLHSQKMSELAQVDGLTEMHPKIESKFALQQAIFNSSSYCISYGAVTLLLNAPVTISLDQNLKPGSCLYREVWEHELKHYRIDVQMRQRLMQLLQQRIGEHLTKYRVLGPYHAQDKDKSVQWAYSTLQALIRQSLVEIENQTNALQQQIDTPQEYARVDKACKGSRDLF